MASNQNVTLTDLPTTAATLSVVAKYSSDSSFDSAAAALSISMSKLASPSSLAWSVSSSKPDSGTVSWAAVTGANSYAVYLDGVLLKTTSDISSEINNISLGAHTASVIAKYVNAAYSNASQYDSDAAVVSFSTVRLVAPTLTKTDSTYIAYRNGERFQYHKYNADGTEADGYPKNPQCVVLSWSGIAKRSSYTLTDSVLSSVTAVSSADTSIQLIQANTTSDSSSVQVSTGNHSYTLVAKYTNADNPNASDYDSLPSNAISISVDVLPAPVISWSADGSSIIDIAVSGDQAANIDFFVVQLTPRLGTAETGAKYYYSSTSKTGATSQYNLHIPANAQGLLSAADDYTVTAVSDSDANFYHTNESLSSNSLKYYSIKQLAKPTALSYMVSTSTLSWTGDANADHYKIQVYTGSSTSPTLSSEVSTTGNVTSYQLSFGAGFWEIKIFSIASTADSTNPVYLDSLSSAALAVGTLDAPVITRNGSYLSWPAVSLANTYKLYNGQTLLAEIPATSASAMSYSLASLPSSLSGISYNLKVAATATIDSVQYSSPDSNIVSFTLKTLAAPAIAYDPSGSSIFKWSAISGADYYDVYIDQGSSSAPTATLASDVLSYTMSCASAGTYYARIVARASDSFLYKTSASSNQLQYDVIKLSAPVIAYSSSPDSSISWSAVSNADHYLVYLNDALTATVTTTTYDFGSLAAGSYGAYVIAENTSQIEYANPRYLISEKSNAVSFGKLATPVLTASDNVISWPAIANASYYEIYNFGTLLTTTPSNQYIIRSSVPASFSIYAIAKSTQATMEASEASNAIEYSILKLGTPTVSYNSETRVLSWTSITNATGYYIFNSGVKYATTASSSYKLPDIQGTSGYFSVQAYSTSAAYLASDLSSPVAVSIASTSAYRVIINSGKSNEVSYDADLPFNLNLTLDETLDSASITTVPTTVKDPYEAYTPVHIGIYDSLGNDIGNTASGVKQKLDFIIDSDEAEEVQIGTGSRYKHHLTLIEPTKLLESEILPNFSITQLLYGVKIEYKRTTGKTSPFSNSYQPYVSGMNDLRPIYSMLTQYHNWYRADFSPTIGSIPHTIVTGASICLPNDYLTTGFYTESYSGTTAFGISTGGWTHTFNGDSGDWTTPGPVKKRWYIRKNNKLSSETEEEYDKRRYAETISGNSDYTLIAEETTIDSTPEIYHFPELGTFDIIMTIESVLTEFGPGLGDDPQYRYIRGMVDTSSGPIKFIQGKDSGQTDEEINAEIKAQWDKMRDYRYEWDGIEVVDKIASAKLEKEQLTVADAMNHAIDVANNAYYDSSINDWVSPGYTSLKYKLDSDIEQKIAKGVKCPEMTFEKGKSLWDVMLELGRLIGGIPRLEKDLRTITFDRLSAIAYPIEGKNNYSPDTTELENIESQLSNHTTSYASLISNMIPRDSIEVFPAGGGWTCGRSLSDTDTYIKRNTLAVVLDKPIFKLIDLQISNFDSGNPDAKVSLIDFVYEKSLFQTLANDAYNKGCALYWAKGDTRIYNIGIIPEATEAQAMWGLSGTQYVIQNILNKLGYTNLGDVNNYHYKAWFIPYSDARVITEKAQRSGLANDSSCNLNQENNTISDDTFGKSAQTQVERLGNNSITKTMRLPSIANAPAIGAIKTYDGFDYFIDNETLTIGNNYVDATAEFSKNWNKINDRVGINSEYRQYEIYGSDWVDRDLSFSNYCYVSTLDYGTPAREMSSYMHTLVFEGLSGSPRNALTSFYIGCLDEDTLSRLTYTTYTIKDQSIAKDEIPAKVNGLAIPAAYYTFRNSIMYTAAMKDNFSAGVYQGSIVTDTTTGESRQMYLQKDARYVNDIGKTPIMEVTLCSPTESELWINDGMGYSKDSAWGPDRVLPNARFYVSPTISNLSDLAFTRRCLVRKDNREAMRFVYQLHFLTYDKHITIQSGLTRYLFKPDTSFTTAPPVLDPGYLEAVGYISPTMISQGVYDADASYILAADKDPAITGKPRLDIASTSGHSISIGCPSAISGSASYAGIAFIWSNTGEVAIDYRFDSVAPVTSIPTIYLNFSADKLAYRSK
jgi:hypothetical protein